MFLNWQPLIVLWDTMEQIYLASRWLLPAHSAVMILSSSGWRYRGFLLLNRAQFDINLMVMFFFERRFREWAELQWSSSVLCLSRGHREDMDRSHRASEPHVSLLTLASHTWCWACVCVHVPFHALFSPSLCEAAPSVSKFICHTSSGLVQSRESLHTLFMQAKGVCVRVREGQSVFISVYVCVCLFTYSM